MMSGPIIDMTPEGEFPRPPGTPIATQILRVAVMVAVLAGAMAVAAFALWIALLLIPVAIVAVFVGWLAWRWRIWKQRGRYAAARGSVTARRAASASRL